MVTGIDVAADRLSCVPLDPSGTFAGGGLYAASGPGQLTKWAVGPKVIGVDAFAQVSAMGAPEAPLPRLIFRGLSLATDSDEQMLDLSGRIHDSRYQGRQRATLVGREPA